MTPSTTIYDLIKSLTQAEKKYFRAYASRHTINEQNLYLSLFDVLNLQPMYNEADAKTALEKLGSKVEGYASLKNFLQKILLQSMREFHRERHPHRVAMDMVADAMYLYNKGLWVAAIKMLNKARNEAQDCEAHDILIHIAELGVEYQMSVDQILDNAHQEGFAADSEEALLALGTNNRLKRLSFKLLYIARRNYRLRDLESLHSLEEVALQPLLQHIHQGFTPQYQVARILATLGQLRGDFESSFLHRRRILELWEEFPKMKRVHPQLVATSHSNYLAACKDTNRWEEMPPVIAKLEALRSESPTEEVEITQNVAYYDLLYHMNTRKWDGGRKRATMLEEMQEKHRGLINKARLLTIRYNVAIYYFFMEEFRSALRMVNAIIHDDTSAHREDVQQMTRLMQAVIHFELENTDILSDMLRSVKRFLDKRGATFSFEKELIRSMNRLAGTVSKTDRHEILTELSGRLEVLRSDPENRDAPGLREIDYWVQARLEGKRLRDCVN